MIGLWEETRKEEEKIAERKSEGESLQVGGVQMAPELLVSQVLMKEMKQKEEAKNSEYKKEHQSGRL